ncbi:hypothetical protein [Pseudomonas typographi]|uniref:Uncharacterized protein n=1 Tax=Pseudomonas typographi TaxID=2715964 RepID=A0ABR7YZI6_9PSED|nr:hypothetical protein [Pseudomonas typographi]MBD1553620.1 hypothetical protein [Pseudomonas typographi]MBD1586699.1 hypothetical protein [Pseudomonas typographi]MBD1598592.1 hypothetical protein [Pseudomonas typographi]
MKNDQLDQLSQDFKLLSRKLAEMEPGTDTKDPVLRSALLDLAEAARILKNKLEEFTRAQAGQSSSTQKKASLRSVKRND